MRFERTAALHRLRNSNIYQLNCSNIGANISSLPILLHLHLFVLACNPFGVGGWDTLFQSIGGHPVNAIGQWRVLNALGRDAKNRSLGTTRLARRRDEKRDRGVITLAIYGEWKVSLEIAMAPRP